MTEDLISALVDALAREDDSTAVTSIRQGRSLREAAKLAVDLGWASTANDGVNRALREQLEAFALRVALDHHLSEHPEARPGLGEIALALAELEHSPLADQPDLVRRAADEIVAVKPDADAEDVLVWALARQTHVTA